MPEHDAWRELAQQLRVDAVRASAAAGSGHPTSALSAADLMAVLLHSYLRYDFSDPDNPNNDRLIFSKGHATPLLYALYRAAGAISEDELLTYRDFGSRLEGHPTPVAPWVDVATGSLGQGLPLGVGLALTAKRLDRLPYRVWVLCGDSEMTEGSMWEAFEHASHAQLDNLTAVIDVNRLGQRGETMHGWDLGAYAARARAFGWEAFEVDGHDVAAVDDAYAAATAVEGRPAVVIARTVKGRGVSAVEDQVGFHGKALKDADEAVAELGGVRDRVVSVATPGSNAAPHVFSVSGGELPAYKTGDEVATRAAYGEALAALGHQRGDVVALDGEVSNSTMAEHFQAAHPERFFEMYIAEQQMVAAAVGMQTRGWVPFVSTFAAFLSRAYDFVRMAAVSRADLCLVGSHAGVSIGGDGPSQMGLEDLAALRAVYGSTILYPCDANQTARLLPLLADRGGIRYLRTTRGASPVIYGPEEIFEIGGAKVLRASDTDAVAVVAAGVTVHEALKAADALEAEGVRVRVIDLYSVKPLHLETLREAVDVTDGRLVTVEDHWPEGGLGDAVLAALADAGLPARVRTLAVHGMPGSGTPQEQLDAARISDRHIAEAARALAAG